MKISDQKLRSDRLVFYAQDVQQLESELDGFLELSGAKCALLIDCEGHLVTRRGEASAESVDSLAALTAGSFAATRQMAKLLGEEQFSTLSHQGQRESIQISLVGERTLLTIVWDERTNLGLVRYYAQETSRCMLDLLKTIGSRPPSPDGDGLADDYSEQATAALDDLF
jgi:predicted regulator of Ras-like GTPase activity (Roadblock/LC7/MglB family)